MRVKRRRERKWMKEDHLWLEGGQEPPHPRLLTPHTPHPTPPLPLLGLSHSHSYCYVGICVSLRCALHVSITFLRFPVWFCIWDLTHITTVLILLLVGGCTVGASSSGKHVVNTTRFQSANEH
ncbi:hypothetical protein TRVL_09709 [Trypanosoma vivax]|nr:hypothetical protein TRVL_09709 [Trypanosoma vivax]